MWKTVIIRCMQVVIVASEQSRRPTESTRKVPVSSNVGSLKKEKLEEGGLVVMDQFVVHQGGRLFITSG